MWRAVPVLVAMACSGDVTAPTDLTTGDSSNPKKTVDTGPSTDHSVRAARILTLTGDESAGAQGYLSFCTGCHGADGTGVERRGPSLVELLESVTRRRTVEVILAGEGQMPSFDDSLANPEIADITAYVLASFGPG